MKVFRAALGLIFTLLSVQHYVFLIILIAYVIFTVLRFERKTKIVVFIFIGIGVVLIILYYLLSLYQPQRYFGLITSAKENYVLLSSFSGTFHVEIKAHDLAIGDLVSLEGERVPLVSDYTDSKFSFNQYLSSRGAIATIKEPHVEILYQTRWRPSALKENYLKLWPAEEQIIIKSILFGERDYESAFNEAANSLNVMFLFSISGVYINSFIRLLEKPLLLKFNKMKARILALILVLPLWLFNMDKFSFYRIYLSNIVRLTSKKSGHQHSTLAITSAVMIAFLILKPSLVINSAFYLGFGISLLMIFLRSTLLKYRPFKRKIMTTVAIYFLVLPVNIASTYYFSLFGPLLQLIIRPLGTIIFTFSYLGLLLNVVIKPLIPLISLLNKFINIMASLEFRLDMAPFPPLLLVVYYGIYLLVTYAHEIGLKPVEEKGALSLIAILLLQLFPLQNQITKAVYFINVGQGDAILFHDHNTSVLIDTGGSHYQDIAEDVLIPFLIKSKIRQLDAVIISHDDFDHNGALKGLQDANKVKNVYDSAAQFPLAVGDFRFFNLNQSIASQAEDNDKSLVLYTEFIGEKWLLMGDATKKIEQEIINNYPELDASILKIGHHGSNTSTMATFLDHVSPHTAIISVGKNYYGHPHQDVVDLLNSHNIEIRRTDIESTISYVDYSL